MSICQFAILMYKTNITPTNTSSIVIDENFYSKKKPPAPERPPIGTKAKPFSPDKENPRPQPLPGKIASKRDKKLSHTPWGGIA